MKKWKWRNKSLSKNKIYVGAAAIAHYLNKIGKVTAVEREIAPTLVANMVDKAEFKDKKLYLTIRDRKKSGKIKIYLVTDRRTWKFRREGYYPNKHSFTKHYKNEYIRTDYYQCLGTYANQMKIEFNARNMVNYFNLLIHYYSHIGEKGHAYHSGYVYRRYYTTNPRTGDDILKYPPLNKDKSNRGFYFFTKRIFIDNTPLAQ